jgi:tRNA-specific 2-thiouridylase
MFYTLGQRHGLGIGGPGEAWYVVAKDKNKNTLFVQQGEHHPALYTRSLSAEAVHWIAGGTPALPLACHAKTRYRQPDQACTIPNMINSVLEVEFDAPQRAVTPGQSVVFYQNEVCLGGGIISAAEAASLHVAKRA